MAKPEAAGGVRQPGRDPVYKDIYGHAFMVAELLRVVLAQSAAGLALLEALDLSSLTRESEQSVSKRHRTGARDMVWRVRLKPSSGGSWLHLFLFIEFQSDVDFLMPLRVRTYFDDFQMELWRGKRFGANSRLQPALAIVIHAGQSKWRAAQRVAELVAPEPSDVEQGIDKPALRPDGLFSGEGYLLLDSAQLTPDDGHDHNAAWLLAAFENPSPTHLAAWVEALRKRLAAPELKALQETILRWADWAVRQRIGLDMGVSDMAQVNALQGDGELSDYVEARRRAWMEGYREEGRQEGRREGREEELRISQQLLAQVATRRFGPQIGQRLANVLTDADDRARFEQVLELILDSADGKELLRGLDEKFS
ncbi:MAG: hypothetical protein F4171_01190 [Gammaproteobacteria bacterium]|nr:hypothetical protein [Gammaproteobacteria bacterium]MYG11398.1 hypothetical protein [Gammaproteobacteria bacterium]